MKDTQLEAGLTSHLTHELDWGIAMLCPCSLCVEKNKKIAELILQPKNDGLNWIKWNYSELQEFPKIYGDPIIRVQFVDGTFKNGRFSSFCEKGLSGFNPKQSFMYGLIIECAIVHPEKFSIEEKKDILINYNFIREVFGVWRWGDGEIQPKFEAKNFQDAIDATWKLYERAEAKGKLKSLSERDAGADSNLLERLKRKYTSFSKEMILAKIEELNNSIKSLQKSGKSEMSGSGHRKTSAAVSNEGARDAGQEKLHLQIYLQHLNEI